MRGMIETFAVFSGSMYYMMLSSNLFVRLKEFNAKDKMNSIKFHIPPIVFGLFSVIFSAFIFADSGQNDYYFDGITDGSISELLHIIVIFVICPYSIYAIVGAQPMVGRQQQNFAKIKSRHIYYMVVFLVCWVPSSLIELFPMIVKGVRNNVVYQVFAQLSLTLSNFGGIFLFFARLGDEEFIEKVYILLGDVDKYCAYVLLEGNKPSSKELVSIIEVKPPILNPLLNKEEVKEEPASASKRKDEDLAVYEDIIGSLAGISLKIEQSYDKVQKDSEFLKKVLSLQKKYKKPVANSEQRINEEINFYSNDVKDNKFTSKEHFTSDFVSDPQNYDIEIVVKEYSALGMMNFRLLNGYTREFFYEALKPKNNEEKLQKQFENTAGRGGCPLFVTHDRNLIFKQLNKDDKDTLIKKFIKNYQSHAIKNGSLICQILGTFSIKINDKKKIYCMIMQNIDPIHPDFILFKYDLKMSSVSRNTLKGKSDKSKDAKDQYAITYSYVTKLHPELTQIMNSELNDKESELQDFTMNYELRSNFGKLKDTDFKILHSSLPVSSKQSEKLKNIIGMIKGDVKLLESLNIMDYSLIITVVLLNPKIINDKDKSYIYKDERNHNSDKIRESLMGITEAEREGFLDQLVKCEKNGNCFYSPDHNFAYIFGIIDVLQQYNIEKMSENIIKKIMLKVKRKSRDISAQPPNKYSRRFIKYLGNIFKVSQEDDDAPSIIPSHISRKIEGMGNQFAEQDNCLPFSKLLNCQEDEQIIHLKEQQQSIS